RVPAHGAPDALARAVVAERDRADVALVRLVPRDAVVATATAGLGLAATGGVRAGVVAVTVARRGGLGRGAHRRSPIRVPRPGGRAWRALACCRGVPPWVVVARAGVSQSPLGSSWWRSMYS